MYSEYCGNEFNGENTKSCPSSDTTINEINNVTESKKTTAGDVKKRKRKHLITSLITTAVLLVFAWIIFPNNNPVKMVQNGYLGMYTDITVKEILDSTYGSIYSNSDWDWGYTDSEELVVEVNYYNDTKMISTTIQFTVLENDDDCFRVTYIEDPSMYTVEDDYDFLVALNDMYIQAYHEKEDVNNEDKSVIDIIDDSLEFRSRLCDIDSICAVYGASSNYKGDRSQICKLDYNTPTGINVCDLMDDAMFSDIFGQEYSEYK